LTPIDPRVRICAVCARVLDYQETGDPQNLIFKHTPEVVEDHPPVAVLPGEVFAITFCDLCFASEPGYVLPAEDFEYPGGTDGSAGNWQICGPCAGDVERNRWNAIIRRHSAGLFARFGEHLDATQIVYLRKIYRLLRSHITGSPFPGRMPTPETKDR
jgi:hypothetical protein